MAQVQFPYIITFSNQKGGVGKTTLCVAFANFLSSMGLPVRVLDCDPQQSLSKIRKRDIVRYGETVIPYDIEKHRKLSRDEMRVLIENIFEGQPEEIILFDCPGTMTEDWLIPLFTNSDMVVIPFHYDDVTITSTSEFIIYVERMTVNSDRQNPPRLYLIPNRSDKRIGTLEELKRWEETREKFEEHGTVTPRLPSKADIPRISTIADFDRQLQIVKPAFNKIYRDITGNLDPYGEPITWVKSKNVPKNDANSESVPVLEEDNTLGTEI